MPISGGFKAIKYSLEASRKVGFKKMFQAITSKNSCKTCAYGMGGQKGGMVNETGDFPEICKKAFQVQITDIQPHFPDKLFHEKSIEDFKNTTARKLEKFGRLNTLLYKNKGDLFYSTISWDKALDTIVNRF